MYRTTIFLAAIFISSCGQAPDEVELGPTWFDEPEAELPQRFSEFGVFEGADVMRPDVVAEYEPRYPLWSAGAEKRRAVWVPPNETIDNSESSSSWGVPDGSVFFKTFFWESRPVETRVMRRQGEDWEFAAYLWDEDGGDAERLEMRRSTPVDVTFGEVTFEHRVPNETDCRKCHEPTDGMVLGFDELQLGSQVDELHERGVLEVALGAEPRELPASDGAEREVLAGFVGNCVNCHNGSDHDQASFDLNPEVAFDNIIGRSTESSASAAGIRVVPGEPSESILFLAVSGETDDPEIKEMPPVGLELRDDEWVESVRTWIESLPAGN